ncbi:protein virilizer homolog [Ciona intestinalis]
MKLLFCDTFSQEPPDGSVTNSWAIIDFPCAVVLEEIRIIPRGSRLSDQLCLDGQRGNTIPAYFRIDFFACDIKNENASTFENLCALDYHENSKTSVFPRLPFLTNKLLCCGRYNSVTVAVFGAEGSDASAVKAIHDRRENLSRVSSRPPPNVPPPTHGVEFQTVDDLRAPYQGRDSRDFMRNPPLLPLPGMLPQPNAVGDLNQPGYPNFGQDTSDRLPISTHNFPNPPFRDRGGDNFMFRGESIGDKMYRNQVSLLQGGGNNNPPVHQRGFPHVDQRNYRYQPGNSRYMDQDHGYDRIPQKFPPTNRGPHNEQREADTMVEDETKYDDEVNANQMQNDEEWMGAEYEEISDDEMDEEANLRDMEAMMTADMLLPPSMMTFNPFDMEVFPLSYFRSPDVTDYEALHSKLNQQNYDDEIEQTNTMHSKSCQNLKKLVESTLKICPVTFKENGVPVTELCEGKEQQWVNNLEKITLNVTSELPYLDATADAEIDYYLVLAVWAVHALDLDGPLAKLIALNVRAIKVGLGLVKVLCGTCAEAVDQLDKLDVVSHLLSILLEQHVASSVKVQALHALDAATNWPAMLHSFLFKPIYVHTNNDEITSKHQAGYAWVIEIALQPQAARVAAGLTQLTKKAHLYECMHQVQVVTQSFVMEQIPDEYAYVSEDEEDYNNEEEVQGVEMVVMSSASADEEEEDEEEENREEVLPNQMLNEHTKVDLSLRIVHEKGERKVIGLSRNSESCDSQSPLADVDENDQHGEIHEEIVKESNLMPVESVINMNDVTVKEEELMEIAGCLNEITSCFRSPQKMIGQLPILIFPLSRRQRPSPTQENNKISEQTVYRMAEGTNLLSSIQALVSLPIVSGHKVLFDACGRFLELLMSSQSGLLYLASNCDSALHIIQHLMRSSLMVDVEAQDSPCRLGAKLAFHLQTIQSLDLVSGLLESDADEEDVEEELVHAFKTLYSITYIPLGKQCVSQVLSKEDNIKSLITCLTFPHKPDDEKDLKEVESEKEIKKEEKTEKSEVSSEKEPSVETEDEKKPEVFHHRTAVNNYAGALLLLTLQRSEDMTYIYKHLQLLLKPCFSKQQLISHSEDIQNWLTPLQKQLVGDVSDIEKLTQFIKMTTPLLEWLTLPDSGPELCMALRLLCHVCFTDSDEDFKDDAESRVRVMRLFATDSLNIILSFIEQLHKTLQFACHGHRAMASGMQQLTHCMVASMAHKSYSLLHQMLSQLLGASIDTKTVNGERIALTVISLYSDLYLLLYPLDSILLDQMTEQAISILSLFFSPSSCSDQSHTVLKQITTFAENQCDNFLPTLTLLSHLLPLPLPIISPQEPPDHAQASVVATCRLWSSIIPSHLDEIMSLLLPLSSSTCRPLVELTIIIIQQLVDLSPTLAHSLVKKYAEEMAPLSVSAVLAEQEGNELPAEETGEKEMLLSPEQITVIQTFAEIISLPAAKSAFLCASRSEPQGVLDLWQHASCEDSPTDAVAAILLLAYVLVDQDTTLLPLDGSTENYANALPSTDQITAIATLALRQLSNSSPRVYNRALLVLCNLTGSSVGIPIALKCIVDKPNHMRNGIKRVCDGFNVTQSSSVDAAFHMLQLIQQLLTPDVDNPGLLTIGEFKALLADDGSMDIAPFLALEKQLSELACNDRDYPDHFAQALDQLSALRQSISAADVSTSDPKIPEAVSLPEPLPLHEQFANRPIFALGEHDPLLYVRQSLTAPQNSRLHSDIDDYRVVECDLIATADKFCPGYDLAEQVNKLAKSSGLQDDVEESEAAAAARAKRRQKVETFSARFGKTMTFIKRSHGLLVSHQRPGRGRGRGNPSNRPYDLFRHRKQNTSRPPSMHVDDFLAADEEQQKFDDNSFFKPPAPMPSTSIARRNSQPSSFKREFTPRGRGSRGGSSRNGSSNAPRGGFSRFASTGSVQNKFKPKSVSTSSGNGRVNRIPDRFRGPNTTTRITSRLSFSPREGYKTNKTQPPPWESSRNFSATNSFRNRGLKVPHRIPRTSSFTQFHSPGVKQWGVGSSMRRGRGYAKPRGRGKHSRSITH